MVNFQGWSSRINKNNHLGSIFQLKPQRVTDIMVPLLALYRGKSLEQFLSQFPTKEFDTDDEYTWDVIGSARRNVSLREARDEFGNAVTGSTDHNVGIGTAPFQLVFDEAYFFDGDWIVGNYNELYPIRVLGDAKFEGTLAVYDCELGGGITDGIPPERLLAGEKFSYESNYVESELSRRVGGLNYSAPVQMRNEFSTIRLYEKVPGSMLNKKVAFGIPMVKRDESGKQVKSVDPMWMHYVDWEFEMKFDEAKNNAILFGRSNRNANGEYMNFGKSGSPIKMGDGLLAQMEAANTFYYNDFSLDLLVAALYDLSASKLGMGERHFVINTGEQGAIQFHKAVNQDISGWTQFEFDNSSVGAIQKTTSPLHKNALKAGYQFTEYMAPNGLHVSLNVQPWYDDPVRNKIMINGFPAMSYRYDILYIGTMDQPNIMKCKIKGQTEARSYQWGIRNPFTGQFGNPYMSYDEDSASVHKLTQLGVAVLDPTRTLSLIPAVLQG